MEDLGEPTSYLAASKGVPVYSSDGQRLGRVVRILSAPKLDMFDGIVFDTTAGPGGHRFVDAPEVDAIYERGVVLKIDAAEAESLPAPSANPGALSVNPADLVGGGRPGFFRRAWSAISGKR
ncbi:MAG: hypothetical protein QOF13_1196 [Solirubrobacterales bacterium]|jgi:hypothetical protein|nr:hypothetical protein [Solirubrobacterales bacterium]